MFLLTDIYTETNGKGAMDNIPSPFKTSLVWPATITKNKKKKSSRQISFVWRVTKTTITTTRGKVKKTERGRRTKKV